MEVRPSSRCGGLHFFINMNDDKPFKTLREQAELICSRGCVGDIEKIEKVLGEINYYRLSGYWFPLRKIAENHSISNYFIDGVNFDEILSIYQFDQQLRNLIALAVDKFENKLRMQVAYQWALANKEKTNAPQEQLFSNPKMEYTYKHITETFERLREREDFLQHYYQNRHCRDIKTLPIWVLVEFIFFSDLENISKNLDATTKHSIANAFKVNDLTFFSSIIALIKYLRNTCAHHLRLWNKNWYAISTSSSFYTNPILKMPASANYPVNFTWDRKLKKWNPGTRAFSFDTAKTGIAIAILSMLLNDKNWTQKIVNLLNNQKFPYLNFEKQIGLHPQWRKHPCFNIN